MDDRWIIDGTPSRRFAVYSRANTGEVLPDPASPLGWTLVWLPGVVEGWADGHVSLGTFERWEFGSPPECCDVFGGYLYINVSVARVYGERTPGASAQLIDDVFFGDHPDVPAYEPHPDDASEAARERMVKTLDWVLGAESLPELLDDRAEVDALVAARPPLGELSDVELVAHARSIVPLVRRLFDRHFLVSASAAFGPGVAGAVLAELDAGDALLPLLAGIGDVDSAALSHALWELSRRVRRSPVLTAAFDAGVDEVLGRIDRLDDPDAGAFREALAAFLRDFGSRGPNEWDIYAHTWGTRPEIALVAVDRMRHQDDAGGPDAGAERRAGEQAELWETVAGRASPEQLAQLRAGVRSGQVFLSGRERTKTNIVKAIHEVRLAIWEVGRRRVERGLLDEPRQLCMLLDSELDDAIEDLAPYDEAIRRRQRERDDLLQLRPPWVVNGVAPPLSSWTRRDATWSDRAEPGDVLNGGRGIARLGDGASPHRHRPRCGGAPRAGRDPRRAGHRSVLDAAVPHRRCRGGRRRGDGQPRHDRVPRAGHPVRGLGHRRDATHPGGRRGDRRRHQGDRADRRPPRQRGVRGSGGRPSGSP